MDGTGDLFAPLTAALGPGAAVDVVRYSGTQPQSYAEIGRASCRERVYSNV